MTGHDMAQQPPAGNAYSATSIKYRSMGKQIGLMIITLGFYSVYWFLMTARELQYLAQDGEASPELWTVFLFIPFVNFYSYYKYSQLYDRWNQGRYEVWLVFVLWIFFSPAVWFLVQSDLNKVATVGRPDQG
jgi:Domain of unknown function (DUF4234)